MAFLYARIVALAFTLFFIGHLRAGSVLTEPYPSPHASFNSSGSPIGADVHPDADSPGLLQHGSGGSFEDPFDFKRKRPPRVFFDDSGDIFFISFAALQELAAGLLNFLMPEGHDTMSEPVDDNGGSSQGNQGNQGNPSSGQNSGGISVFVRSLLNCFCGCFTGGTGGGDDEEPYQHRQSSTQRSHYIDYEDTSSSSDTSSDEAQVSSSCSSLTTPANEAAAQLIGCEQRPINCANCQAEIKHDEFNIHLQSCISQRPEFSEFSETQVRLLLKQLVGAYEQAIVPDPAQNQSPLIRLTNHIVLQPLTGSPEVFTRIGAQSIEFYVRVDLSKDFEPEGYMYELVRCKPTQEDITFNIEAYATFYQELIKRTTVKLTFSYKSPTQLSGDWRLQTFDFNGKEIGGEKEIIFAGQIFVRGRCILFDYSQINHELFNWDSDFWERPKPERICYLRVQFIPK